MWTPSHFWMWAPPVGGDPTKRAIDIRPYSQPQSFLVRFWRVPVTGTAHTIFRTAQITLVLGPLLLIWAAIQTRRERE